MSDRTHTRTHFIGAGHLPGVKVTFTGVQYEGDPAPLDTEVVITAGTLCAITWKDCEAFRNEVQAVIDKYLI